MSVFTFLHISDLHRNPRDPISNNELISCLVADMSRYQEAVPPIPHPDAIVVSGDLVQGIAVGSPDYPSALQDQYQVAYEFLCEIAERFVNGDHARIVIVPGNHDVDSNAARKAMVEEPKQTGNLRRLLEAKGSPYRWSWDERKLYRIENQSDYEKRFGFFRNLAQGFYKDATLTHPYNPNSYFNLFEFDNQTIALVAFNSCQLTDCFSDVGSIPNEALSDCHMLVYDSGIQYKLKIAVWHHCVGGAPLRSDYMNAETVGLMIDRGFRLVLHGHQHKSDAQPFTIHVSGEETMIVVSAGSLCAGQSELPPGVHRQYNIIAIGDDYQSAKVHVREMTMPNIFTAGRLSSLAGSTYTSVNWSPEERTTVAPRKSLDVKTRGAILRADERFHEKDFSSVISILKPLFDRLNRHGRQLLKNAMCAAESWEELSDVLATPTDVEEVVMLVKSKLALGRYDEAQTCLEKFADAVSLPTAMRSTLVAQIEAERRMHQ